MFPYPFEVSNSCLNGNKPLDSSIICIGYTRYTFLDKTSVFCTGIAFFYRLSTF